MKPMKPLTVPSEFRPQRIPRRGEITAWALTLVVVATLAFVHAQGQPAPGFAWFLAVFFGFSALSISLGNWMDRNTVLRLREDGVEFHNGLRHVSLTWPQIQKVIVRPARWGQQVAVIGEGAHFEFRTLGEVVMQGKVRGRMGFEEGEAILEHILQATGLTLQRQDERGRYYARA